MEPERAGRGRVAVVTGARQGLGRVVAQHLAGQGYALARLDLATSAATEESVRVQSVPVLSVEVDVADEAGVRAAADALVLKVREGGRVVNVHALLAAGVNGDGRREILGLQVSSAEDGAGWLAFFAGPDRPRPDRCRARHLRCPPRPRRRRRRHPARRGLATLPHPLRGQHDGRHPEGVMAVGAGAAALRL